MALLAMAVSVITLLINAGALAEAATSADALTAPAAAPLTTTAFATQAAQANLTELKRSQLAATHSDSPQLRLFAEQMIIAHEKAGTALRQLAGHQGLTLPAAPMPSQSADLAALAQQQGRRFDATYLKQLQRDQEAATRLFERAADDRQLEAGLRDFARTTLPLLREHQQRARELNGNLAGLQPMPAVAPSRQVHHVW